MSYQVIARKWRPQTFEEVTGQEFITRTLRNAIESEKLHHAYLFSGARGVGKTTTARLLAKALNCHKTQKPNPTPCIPTDKDACVSCREIAEGRSIDVQEIDAASNTGVQNVRDSIIDTINIRASRDRYKVFVIDEVHQLSKQAFDALLKTLEEPPPNVVFVLATTELHKVPATILSRCQEFIFRTIPTTKIYDRLKLIAETEKIKVGDDALREIARSGEGSMRDAQSNFDQVISFSGEKITTDDVINALGLASTEILSRTISAVASQNAKEVMSVVEELISRGQDLRAFCRDLLVFIRELLIAKISEPGDSLIDSAIVPFEKLRTLGAEFSEKDLLRFFSILGELDYKLRNANEPRYALEIGLMKLVEMRRLVSFEVILDRLSKLEAELGVARENTPDIRSSSATTTQGSSSATAEKKTLVSDLDSTATSDSVLTNSANPSPKSEREFAPEIPSLRRKPYSPAGNFEYSVRHQPISSEELAHVEDSYLDYAFEDRLRREGDSLRAIKDASRLVEQLLSHSEASERHLESAKRAAAGNGVSTETAGFVSTPTPSEPETTQIPVLPENPTAEELRQFAENHPKIKLLKRVLHSRIVKVEKREKI